MFFPKKGVFWVKKDAYKNLRLREFNTFDTERTLRENIYELETENKRIEAAVTEMKKAKLPDLVILESVRQMENNAAEIAFMTSLIQLDLNTYKFSEQSTILGRSAGK